MTKIWFYDYHSSFLISLMPELPEVETIRRDLEKKIAGKKIKTVTVHLQRLVKSDYNNFIATLEGNTVTALNRRGKLLLLTLKKSEYALLVHLKMTGQLIYQKGKKIVAGGHSFSSMEWNLPNKYSYIIIEFADGGTLFFNDMRTFGYMRLANPEEQARILSAYGIEPLQPDFTLQNFRSALDARTISIKAALLNQAIISGIGNIYADEICFYAGVKPMRLIPSLTNEEIKKLHRGANAIIKQAIKERGTTFNNYVDAQGRRGNFLAFLKVFGRQGKACRRCQEGIIKKIRHAGRGTHYCPVCQA